MLHVPLADDVRRPRAAAEDHVRVTISTGVDGDIDEPGRFARWFLALWKSGTTGFWLYPAAMKPKRPCVSPEGPLRK
jgi:hypothetical protein